MYTPKDSAVVFIDHQPQMTIGVANIDRSTLINEFLHHPRLDLLQMGTPKSSSDTKRILKVGDPDKPLNVLERVKGIGPKDSALPARHRADVNLHLSTG